MGLIIGIQRLASNVILLRDDQSKTIHTIVNVASAYLEEKSSAAGLRDTILLSHNLDGSNVQDTLELHLPSFLTAPGYIIDDTGTPLPTTLDELSDAIMNVWIPAMKASSGGGGGGGDVTIVGPLPVPVSTASVSITREKYRLDGNASATSTAINDAGVGVIGDTLTISAPFKSFTPIVMRATDQDPDDGTVAKVTIGGIDYNLGSGDVYYTVLPSFDSSAGEVYSEDVTITAAGNAFIEIHVTR